MPRWRKMTWVLVIWCAVILIWAIAGGENADCGEEQGQLAQDACEAGTGIGIAIILFIGFIGFVFFSLIWFMSRPRDQHATPSVTTTGGPPPPAQAPAAWYPDPDQPGMQRYWDGTAWTEHRAPVEQPPQ